jgi:hypothetical protein
MRVMSAASALAAFGHGRSLRQQRRGRSRRAAPRPKAGGDLLGTTFMVSSLAAQVRLEVFGHYFQRKFAKC